MTARLRLGGVALCLLAFAALAFAVRATGTEALDLAVNAFFTAYRAPWLLAAFVWFTALGTEASRLAMVLTASALLWSDRRSAMLVPLWASVLGSETTTWAAKFLIGRPRPVFLPGVATASSPSFPSAHSAGTMALVGILAYVVAVNLPGRRARRLTALAAAAVVALIGFSRIFLNVHYLTDVASGFLVGGAWVLIGTVLADAAGRGPSRP